MEKKTSLDDHLEGHSVFMFEGGVFLYTNKLCWEVTGSHLHTVVELTLLYLMSKN